MTKIRKQKRRQRYRYNVNRKRMNRKKNPKSQSKIIKDAWVDRVSCQQNLKRMGLIYDVNKEIKINEEFDESSDVDRKVKPTTQVAEELENEANKPREKRYRLPKNQVEYLIYLLDKYGEDYKAMARDRRNVIQATWKQIRAKINVFKSIPEQYDLYLQNRQHET